MIQAFSKKLMDHIANDAKTPRTLLEKAYAEWQVSRENHLNTESELHDNYNETIEMPRIERTRLYDDYLMDKSRLWEAYVTASQGQKEQALAAYVSHPLPQELHDDNEWVNVYTKNVC